MGVMALLVPLLVPTPTRTALTAQRPTDKTSSSVGEQGAYAPHASTEASSHDAYALVQREGMLAMEIGQCHATASCMSMSTGARMAQLTWSDGDTTADVLSSWNT
jgi:hypothetical protein